MASPRTAHARADSEVVAPKLGQKWVDSQNVSACTSCKAAFSFFSRKHHCRSCGNVFCDDCSMGQALVPDVDPSIPQRVCNPCFARINQLDSNKLLEMKKDGSVFDLSEAQLMFLRHYLWHKVAMEEHDKLPPQVAALGSQLLVDKLVAGGMFFKYGEKGQPRDRHVWVSDDLTKVVWGEPRKKKIHGSLDVAEVSNVLSGKRTAAFQRADEKESPEPRCLSLLTKTRTLDLVAYSSMERDLWVFAFLHLLSLKNKGPQHRALLERGRLNPTLLQDQFHLLNDQVKEANEQIKELTTQLAEAAAEREKLAQALQTKGDMFDQLSESNRSKDKQISALNQRLLLASEAAQAASKAARSATTAPAASASPPAPVSAPVSVPLSPPMPLSPVVASPPPPAISKEQKQRIANLEAELDVMSERVRLLQQQKETVEQQFDEYVTAVEKAEEVDPLLAGGGMESGCSAVVLNSKVSELMDLVRSATARKAKGDATHCFLCLNTFSWMCLPQDCTMCKETFCPACCQTRGNLPMSDPRKLCTICCSAALSVGLAKRTADEEPKEQMLASQRRREAKMVREWAAAPPDWSTVYIIDNKWLTAWKNWLAGGPRPGPISNHRLMDGESPREGLTAVKDYRGLTAREWNGLKGLYGGGPAIRRANVDIHGPVALPKPPAARLPGEKTARKKIPKPNRPDAEARAHEEKVFQAMEMLSSLPTFAVLNDDRMERMHGYSKEQHALMIQRMSASKAPLLAGEIMSSESREDEEEEEEEEGNREHKEKQHFEAASEQ